MNRHPPPELISLVDSLHVCGYQTQLAVNSIRPWMVEQATDFEPDYREPKTAVVHRSVPCAHPSESGGGWSTRWTML